MGAGAKWHQVAAAWVFFGVSCVVRAQESLPSLVRRVEPSVVLVQTYSSGGKRLSQGTAFFMGGEGDVVTSRHVLVGAARAQVKASDGNSYAVRAVVAEDRARDLVRLALDIPLEAAKPLPLAQALPEPGETVVVIGSPLGLEQTVTDGIVSAYRQFPQNAQEYIQASVNITFGNSGGPLLDANGNAVGVSVSGRAGGTLGLNFFIPIESALQRLDLKLGG